MKKADEFFVSPDITKAETLPPEAFTSQEFLARELATIFKTHWLMAPQRGVMESREDPRTLVDQLARRGAQAPFTLLDQPLFMQRGMKGALRAFPNVCTHAWHTLVEGAGRERTITCPQHGRQFGADGKFLSQPGFKNLPDFPRPCDHLQSFPVEEWAPLLFTCLGNPRASFKDVFGPAMESVAKLPMHDWRRAAHSAEIREIPGNWKLNAWNYMDKFHIAFLHRAPGGLADAIDLDGYKTELYEHSSLQWAYARDPAHGFDPKTLPARFHDKKSNRRVFALWWLIFPNLTLNFYPWGLSVNVYQPVPNHPDRTLFLWYHFIADEKKYAKRDELWLSSQVDHEDVDAIGQVRRGLNSGAAQRGRFAPEEEKGPHWFHRLVSERVMVVDS